MDSIALPQTRSTPRVHFSVETRTLTLQGESYPENSFQFYEPILAWVDDFLSQPGGPVTLLIDMPYMNSSSTKCMLDLLDRCEDAYRNGTPVALRWSCDPDNSRALELAQEFREEVSFPFATVAPLE